MALGLCVRVHKGREHPVSRLAPIPRTLIHHCHLVSPLEGASASFHMDMLLSAVRWWLLYGGPHRPLTLLPLWQKEEEKE